MKIEVINASMNFSELVIFKDFTTTFSSGNIYRIKGENGSGKTVLLKLLAGYMKLSSGLIKQDAIEVGGQKRRFIDNAGIIIESPQFLGHLTLWENLQLLKSMNKKINDEVLENWIDFFKIEEFKSTKYKHCSLGTKQKMSIIQACAHDPEVLLLDEPFNSLDQGSSQKFMDYLLEVSKDRIIILATHINTDISGLSAKEFLIEEGKIHSL